MRVYQTHRLVKDNEGWLHRRDRIRKLQPGAEAEEAEAEAEAELGVEVEVGTLEPRAVLHVMARVRYRREEVTRPEVHREREEARQGWPQEERLQE